MRALRATELVPSGFIVGMLRSTPSASWWQSGRRQLRVRARFAAQRLAVFIAATFADWSTSQWEAGVRSWSCGARRLFCDASGCQRRVFAERFEGAVARHARRSARLDDAPVRLTRICPGWPHNRRRPPKRPRAVSKARGGYSLFLPSTFILLPGTVIEIIRNAPS